MNLIVLYVQFIEQTSVYAKKSKNYFFYANGLYAIASFDLICTKVNCYLWYALLKSRLEIPCMILIYWF